MGQRGPKVKHDWNAIKAAYLASQHSTREIAVIFNVNPATVADRALKDGWVAQRKKAIAPIQEHVDRQIQDTLVPKSAENGQENGRKDQILKSESTRIIPTAEERIAQLRPKQDTFRQRVAAQTDRLLDHLEGQEILNNMQADAFVTILEKTEKVGSRARGLDRDDEKSRNVLINLSVLNGAPDLAPARVLSVKTTNLSDTE